ncbi:MAG: ATP-binding protein [Thermoanaerobaculaceae bacterium]|nr:ATP-binding protein [Thermoanaerobaculaceae bacterium]
MSPNCKKCEDSGFVIVEIDGVSYSKPCSCTETERATKLLEASNVPEKYRNSCVLSRFVVPKDNPSLKEAYEIAIKYAEDYPVFEEGKPNGLLFMGPCGVGKTHLAVGILNEIFFKKRCPAKFVELGELYRDIKATYGSTDTTEYDILYPLAASELLLIDEMGCVSSTWAQEILLYLISHRYNRNLPTIITTNYLDEPQSGEASLAERIGVRTRSRLYEMCRTVLMYGEDFRKRKRR